MSLTLQKKKREAKRKEKMQKESKRKCKFLFSSTFLFLFHLSLLLPAPRGLLPPALTGSLPRLLFFPPLQIHSAITHPSLSTLHPFLHFPFIFFPLSRYLTFLHFSIPLPNPFILLICPYQTPLYTISAPSSSLSSIHNTTY